MTTSYKLPLLVLLALPFFAELSLATSACMNVEDGISNVCARAYKDDGDCSKGDTVAWDKSSCLVTSQKDVISEVAKLEPEGQIKEQSFLQNSTKKIAESLIYRYFNKHEKTIVQKDIEKADYDIYHNTSILMAISPVNFPLILDKGFLNQHQVQKSRGLLDPRTRRVVEDNIMGISLSSANYKASALEKSATLRPKYAFMLFDVAKKEISENSVISSYGSVFIRFKDEVKKRATFTNNDSLNELASSTGRHAGFQIHSFYFQAQNFRINRIESYYEAQIWGELDSDDIDYILIGCYGADARTQDTIVNGLKGHKLNIPVYSCDSEKNSRGWHRFIPKTQIYPAK
jgi:hypothetical protein